MGWLSDTWESVKENASDICHGVLDAAGFIPVAGAIPDVINGCIYAVEGNALDAGMSFAAAIPGVGDIGAVVGKGGKYLLKGGKWLLGKGKKLLKGAGNLLKALKKSRFLGKLAKLGGKLLGKMKVGAKALLSKGKKLLDKIAEKFKKKCKNGHCFVEGTLVWTEQGLQEIETIPSGALIYARNEETGEVGLKRVKRTLGGKAHTIYTIGIGEHGIIQSTNYHRYYVEEKGWVSAIQLQIGDELCTIEGEHVEITSIEKERQEEGVAVYNFVVEDWESYFVSEVGVYVHNNPCDPRKRRRGATTRDNSKKLSRNLKREGRPVGEGQAAAHIVASTGSKRQWKSAADSRKLLDKYNIDINDAANGIPLGHPRPHNLTHNIAFHEKVNSRLHSVETNMQNRGYGRKATRRALRKELRKIGKEF